MRTRVFRILLVAVLLGTMLFAGAEKSLYVYADQTEEELEQKRQDALNKINSIKSDINTVEKKIKDLKNAKSNLQTYINQLDREVNNLAAQISDLEEQIEKKKKELAEAEEESAEQYELMKKRIQYMYEQCGQSVLELLLSSDSVAEMMNRAEYAVQMSAYDREMMEEMREVRETIAEYKALLEEHHTELEEQKAALNKAIDAKSKEIASYQSQINSASHEQDDYEAQLAKQEKLLDQIEEQIAAAAAAAWAAGDGDGGASGFVWPCPASKRITSYFGPRKAPVKGASTYHKGIDIGAPTGTSIVASAGGRVTTSKYSSSAGNYVVVSHGNGVSTVYMHASKLYVKVGDIVGKGQTIAAVGSTGYSSGPHLHFGIIVNGSYVNPLNYVK